MSSFGVSKYNAGLVRLWRPYRNSVTVDQFAELWASTHPDTDGSMFRRFEVPLYTLPGKRRARSVVVDPNIKNGFMRMLYHIRCAFGNVWKSLTNRVCLYVGGQRLGPKNYLRALHAAQPYSLVIDESTDGSGHEWPTEDPARQELEERQEASRRRRAEAEARQANAERGKSAAIRTMLDNVTADYATRMAGLAMKANSANKGPRFMVISQPEVAGATASMALRNGDNYRNTGYSGPESFFKDGLSAPSTSDTVNAFSHDIASSMRNAPEFLRSVNKADLERLYKSKAIKGSLLSQWYDTVKGFVGRASSSTAEYRVAPDYGLVAHDRTTGASYSAPRSHEKRPRYVASDAVEEAVRAGEQPFPSYTLSARDSRTESRIEKWAREMDMIRASNGVSAPAQWTGAKAASESSAPMIGDSLGAAPSLPGLVSISQGIDAAPSLPGLAPISRGIDAAPSLPGLVPISRGIDAAPSLPGLVPISRGIGEPPSLEPVNAVGSPAPISRGIGEPPSLEPVNAVGSPAPISRSIGEPPSLEPVNAVGSPAPISRSIGEPPSLEPISRSIGEPPSLEPAGIPAPISRSLGESASVDPFAPSLDSPPDLLDIDAPAPVAASIAAEMDELYPVFPSISNVASLPVRSLSEDPLAAELAKQVLSDKQAYSGVFVPSQQIIPTEQRAAAASALARMSEQDRARQVKPYLMMRHHTNHTIQSLLTGEGTPETGVIAANMKPWSVQARADGSVHVRNYAKRGQSPAELFRIKEHPAAVMIYTDVPYKEGQK